MTTPGVPASPGSWGAALQELGLDHPALMRLGSTRQLLEQGHRVYEQRRSLEVRLVEAQAQMAALQREYDAITGKGLVILEDIQREVNAYTEDLSGISDRLADRLTPDIPDTAEMLTDESFIQRHELREQYDSILDMFSSFGLYDARSRTIRFQGAKGRVHQVPGFESLIANVLTDELRTYLATARRVGLLLTPAADPRVFAAIGKTVAFNNYAGSNGSAEGADACADFVRRLRVGGGGSGPLADDLLRTGPFDGLRISLYAEDSGPNREVRAEGLPLEATCEDIAVTASDAAERGVEARPLSPPEYLMLQAIRRRAGQPLLDAETDGAVRRETWFPEQELTGAPGTLVARSVPTGLRFRSVELGKGVEGRGYRMAYAPLAA
ncbi:MAG: hypothetical protein AAGA90_01650 [Actinomycetota bacterium]